VHGRQGGHHLLDPRIDAPRLAVYAHQPFHLVLVAHGLERIYRQVQPMGERTLPGAHGVCAAASRDRPCGIRGFDQCGQHHLVGVGEARLLAADGAHADPLLDAVRPLLDDAVLERPGLLPGELKVQVGVIDAAAHHRAEHGRQPALGEPRRRENHLLRHVEHRRRAHAGTASSVPTPRRRCPSAGKRARASACFARSNSAVITPSPLFRRVSTWPQ